MAAVKHFLTPLNFILELFWWVDYTFIHKMVPLPFLVYNSHPVRNSFIPLSTDTTGTGQGAPLAVRVQD